MYFFMKKFYTFTQQNFKKLRAIRSFIAVTLLCVMAIFSVTAQAQQLTFTGTQLQFENMPVDENSGPQYASVSGVIVADLLGYSTAKGEAGNNTCYWSSDQTLRMYPKRTNGNGSSITFTALDGAKIKEIVLHRSSSDNTPIAYNVDGAADVRISANSGTKLFSISSIEAESVKIRHGQNTGSSNQKLYIDSISITMYKKSVKDSIIEIVVCPDYKYYDVEGMDTLGVYSIGDVVKMDTLVGLTEDTIMRHVVTPYETSIAETTCEYPIDVTIDADAPGTITCDLTNIYYNSKPTYTITADPCHEIASILVDGTPITITDKQQMTYTFDPVQTLGREIAVSFADTYYTISVEFDGVTNPTVDQSVICGGEFSYEIPAFTGHHLVAVTVGTDTLVLANDTIAIDSVGEDVTFTAHYDLDEYDMTYTSEGAGTVTGPVKALYGETPVYTFTPQECSQIASVLVDGVEVTSELVGSLTSGATYTFDPVDTAHNISVTFEGITYVLNTIYSGTGFGYCVPQQDTVECNETVLYTINAGTGSYIESYTITNDMGTNFVDMSGFHAASFSFNIDNITSHTTVKVVFNRFQKNVTVVNAGGNGTICCDTAVLYGDSCIVRVDADAAAGYHIDYITDGTDTTYYTTGDVTAEYRIYDIINDVTITAAFAINEYRIVTLFTPEGYATAVPADTLVKHGDPCTINIAADACHYLTTVADSGAAGPIWIGYSVPDHATAYTVNYASVTCDYTIAVNMEAYQNTITGVAMTTNGTVPTVDVDCGEPYDYVITADEGYHVSQVILGTHVIYTAGMNDQLSEYTYHFDQVLSDTTFKAMFAINRYRVTAAVKPSNNANKATITGVPTLPVNHGTTRTITITPVDCWHIAQLLVNGEDKLADATVDANNVVTYTFDVVDTTNIEAMVERLVYDLSWEVVGGENGVIRAEQGANHHLLSNDTIQGSITRNCGTTCYFAIRANEGYHIASISRNGAVETNTNNAFTDTTIKIDEVFQDEEILVEYAINEYSVNTVITGTNTVASSSVTVQHGGSESIVISVADEYHHIATITCGDSVINLGNNDDTTYTYDIANVVSDTDINVVIALDTLTATFVVANNGDIQRTNGYTPYASADPAEADWNGQYIVVSDPAAGSYAAGGSYEIKFLVCPFETIDLQIVPQTCHRIDTIVVKNLSTDATDRIERPATGIVNLDAVADYEVSANFYAVEYTLTANVSGSNGTIELEGDTIVACGTDYTYTITPEEGYHVATLLINSVPADLNDLVEGDSGTYTYTLSDIQEDKNVVVTFAINNYTINASFTDGNGSFTPASTTADHGTSVDLNINLLSTCEHVDTLTINGEKVAVDSLTTGSVYSFVATEDMTIEATTVVNRYHAAAEITGEGTVTEAIVNCNEDHTYTINAEDGWHIASYTFNGTTTTLGSNADVYAQVYVNNMMTDTTITVVFERNTFRLITTVERGMGSWNVDTIDLHYGDSYDFIATADTDNGWHIDRIIVGDSITMYTGNTSSVTYTINPVVADTILRAYFAINQYTLTASVSGEGTGTINPVGDSTVIDRATVEYTIHAEDCSFIDQVLVDGAPVEVTDSVDMVYTFAVINSDHTIEAVFTPNTYYMSSVAVGNGTVNEGYANCSAGFTYNVVAEEGYHIDYIVLDGETDTTFSNQESEYNLDLTNITEAHTLEAYFAINHYTVTVTAGENGTIMMPGTHDVVYGDNMNFTIHAEGCYHIDSIKVNDEVITFDDNTNLYEYALQNIDTDYVVSASFAINTYNITAIAGENGTIEPAGVVTYPCDTTVTYTFTADSGYAVVDVLVNGTSIGVHDSYTFSNIAADNTIEVQFAAITYHVTAIAYGYGAVTPMDTTVNEGASVTLTFTPDSCYTLTEVLVNGASYLDQVANNTLVLSDINADMNVVASYQINTFTVTATAGVGGTITETNVYNCGANVVYDIVVDPCYTISAVTIDGQSQTIATSYSFPAIDADHTIDVQFTINTYTVNASVNNAIWGSITPAGNNTYNCDTTIIFNITPNQGAYIDSVVLDGVNLGAIDSFRIAHIDADHTVEVIFAQYEYTISSFTNGHVTVAPVLGDTTVVYGSNINYTFTVDDCYAITDVIVNGESVGVVANYSFTNVTDNQTIEVVTEVVTYTITATVNDEAAGNITPAGATTVVCDGTQSYNIAAANGYYISDVLVNGNSVGAVSTYTFENVSADNTIEAQFAAFDSLQYTITATAGDHGTIDPAGTITVNQGESATFIMTPDEYYTVGDVLVDGVSVGAVSIYIFSNITEDHTIDVVFVAAECDVPTYVYTTDVTGTSATLNWSDMGATSYTVRYKKLSDTADYTVIPNITTTNYNLTGLDQMTDYIWNVKSVCVADTAESNWSSQVRFTTIATGIVDAEAGQLNVYSYGNSIYVTNNSQEVIKGVRVYDMFGRVVFDGQAENNDVITLQTATGNYVVRVITNKQVHNYKVNIFQR